MLKRSWLSIKRKCGRTIILTLILPAINIMRYQPKEILTGKE